MIGPETKYQSLRPKREYIFTVIQIFEDNVESLYSKHHYLPPELISTTAGSSIF